MLIQSTGTNHIRLQEEEQRKKSMMMAINVKKQPFQYYLTSEHENILLMLPRLTSIRDTHTSEPVATQSGTQKKLNNGNKSPIN